MSVNDIVLLVVSVICLLVGLYLTYKNAQGKIQPGSTVPTVIFQFMADMAIAIQDELKKLDEVSRDRYNSDEEYRKELVKLAVGAIYKVLGTSYSDLISEETITELASKLLEVLIDKVEDSRKKEKEIDMLNDHLKIAKEIRE